MPKKAGKQPQGQAPDAVQQESEKKNTGMYMNNVSQKLIFAVKGKHDGKDYMSVNFEVKGQMCSFLVSPGKVLPSTKVGGADNVGFNNIYLGTENTHINVSPKAKGPDGKYQPSFSMTAKEIADTWKANQKAYQEQKRAQKNAEKSAGREVPEVDAQNEAGVETQAGM